MWMRRNGTPFTPGSFSRSNLRCNVTLRATSTPIQSHNPEHGSLEDIIESMGIDMAVSGLRYLSEDAQV